MSDLNITISRNTNLGADFTIVADGFGIHMINDGAIIEVQPVLNAEEVTAAFNEAGIDAHLVREKIFLRGGTEILPVLADHGATDLLNEALYAMMEMLPDNQEIFAHLTDNEALQTAAVKLRSLLPHATINFMVQPGDELHSYAPVPASAEEIVSGPISELAPAIAQALGINPKGKGRGR